ncbi:ABC transporter substrate-binding protein [Paludicola sp. MB14-C6]|uniref:ABC transporter substrate-binding protein n=1 Tax=Paludihabitans sp. MB14-C6 TaxID=3070656 RepID=UPI0027DB0AE6|nr:ABC transporter substrate-binding protein [Paludicola sp. MB14-C6]WMJ23136.1 ABC transporter substrate-binding protein [Paludicola sp. MB14-C6]
MKKLISIVIIIATIFCFSGCINSSESDNSVSEATQKETSSVESKEEKKADDRRSAIEVKGDKYPLTINDYFDKKTVLNTAPKRVAVLAGSQLNIWYDLGGKSICTSDISKNLKILSGCEEEFKSLPSVGAVYKVNMESIIALKPDLIITQVGSQNPVSEELSKMGYPVLSVNLRSYEDVLDTYRAFGKILQNEKIANEKINAIKKQRADLLSKKPEKDKSVVVLYLTSKSLSVKLDNSIAGDVCKGLGLKNISSDLPPDTIGSESTPLDIEYIVQQNPDYVLVTSMISNNEAAVKTMNKQFEENPAWKGVKAVQEGRVAYLPQEYFLYNAGPYYCEAIEYVARSVYPDIYGKVDKWYGK